MTRLADEFAEILARREELDRERDAAISGPPVPPVEFSDADVIGGDAAVGLARTAAGWWGFRRGDSPVGPFDTADEAARAIPDSPTSALPAEWLSPEAADEFAKLLAAPALAGPLACAFDCVGRK